MRPSLHVCVPVQGAVPAVQLPDWQVSAPLQNSPSEHDVPSGCLASAGQVSEVPLQVSATSQASTAARHVVPLGCF
jgi:hypothetical protein